MRIDDVEDACACALTHGRGRWYETFSAGDRTRLVDDCSRRADSEAWDSAGSG